MKNKHVLWKCQICGYEWKGKSPQVRTTRPYCSKCGSRNVKVKDWLIDKEKWEKARLHALRRAGWQCEACGKDINLSAPVHHLHYDDYYDSDSLVCLCPQCHYLTHGRTLSYKVGVILKIFGIAGIIIGGYSVNKLRLSTSFSHDTFPISIMELSIGVGLVFLPRILARKTREVRRAIKRAVKKRTEGQEDNVEKNEAIDIRIISARELTRAERRADEKEIYE